MFKRTRHEKKSSFKVDDASSMQTLNFSLYKTSFGSKISALDDKDNIDTDMRCCF